MGSYKFTGRDESSIYPIRMISLSQAVFFNLVHSRVGQLRAEEEREGSTMNISVGWCVGVCARTRAHTRPILHSRY